MDSLRVAGLRKDLKEFIIGEEEEAREDKPLGLQVVLQTLLDLIQERVVLLECLQEAWGGSECVCVCVLCAMCVRGEGR